MPSLFRIWMTLFACLLMPLSVARAAGPEVTRLSLPSESYKIGGNQIQYLEDREGKITIEDVAAKGESLGFRNASTDVVNLGYNTSTWWFRMSFLDESETSKPWLLHFTYPSLEHVEAYLESNSHFTRMKGGLNSPYEERAIPSRLIAFPLVLRKGEATALYLRVRSDSNMSVGPVVGTMESFLQNDYRSQSQLSIFFGLMLAMVLYNAFLFISVRERPYFYFVLHVLGLLGFQYFASGMAGAYLQMPPWTSFLRIGAASLSMGILLGLYFCASFLDLHKTNPRMGILFRVFEVILWVLLACSLYFPYSSVVKGIALMGMISSVAMLAAGVIRVLQKYSPARYFLLAWGVFLLAACLYALRGFGFIPTNTFTQYLIEMGTGSQVLLLSFALGDRINHEKKKKEIAQREALHNLNLAHEAQAAVLESQKKLSSSLKLILDCTRQLAAAKEIVSASANTALAVMENSHVDKEGWADLLLAGIRESQASLRFTRTRVIEKGAPVAPCELVECEDVAEVASLGEISFGDLRDPILSANGRLLIPIQHAHGFVGFIVFERYTRPTLAQEDTYFINAVALSLAIAAENIAYVSDVEEKAKLEKEMEAARIVQDALLSEIPKLPEIQIKAYYRAAEQTGGDWYGCYHSDKRNVLYVFIGDVTGHGLPSALLTGMVCGALGVATRMSDSESSSEEIHAVLQRFAMMTHAAIKDTSMKAKRVMTMCFVALDLTNGTLSYVNAAHNSFYSAGESGVSSLLVSGTRLGWEGNPSFGMKTRQLEPGTTLFLYTDGLIENCGPGGETLSARALEDILNRKLDVDAIHDEVLKLGNGVWKNAKPDDDVSFMVVRWLGPCASPVGMQPELAVGV